MRQLRTGERSLMGRVDISEETEGSDDGKTDIKKEYKGMRVQRR